MEHPGEDLRELLRNRSAGGLSNRLRIAVQAAEALDGLHSRGLAHGDVRPENLRLDALGRVELVNPAAPGGSLPADVHGFGIVLAELVAGENPPAGAESAMAGVRDLVMACTAPQPGARPQSLEPVIERLRQILEQLPEAPPRPVREPAKAGPSLLRLSIVVYSAVLLVTGLAIWAWYAFQPPPELPGMIYIPAGTFLAGAGKHAVQLKAFYIDATEVTNAEFSDFCRATGCAVPAAAPELPVVNVPVELARAYARWRKKRLPTPAEWERAARGAKGALFPWGDAEDPSLANVANNPHLAEHRLMPARSFGSYPEFQMIGNAWEMVEGQVNPSPEDLAGFANLLSPPPTSTEPWIAIRGGSYDVPLMRDLAYASHAIPARYAAPDIGFRCAKDP